jgi:endonuclease/exonuclease/phosphatase family metal-dependent hydrolase
MLRPACFVSVIALVACSTSPEGTGPISPPGPPAKAAEVTVLTRNVYLGAEVEPILGAKEPLEIPGKVKDAWARVEANRFAERAAAIADEIARTKPHLVGLQEVARFERTVGDRAPVPLDYLELLQVALAARGLVYAPVVVQVDSDVEMPTFDGAVRMIDRDVILARDGVTTRSPEHGRFGAGLVIPIADTSVEIVRGWASVVATVDGATFRFVTTHLEDQVPEIQAAQGGELVRMLAGETLPIVLTGDLNSRADGTGTSTYATVIGAGWNDAWSKARPMDPGFSCCQPADLAASEGLRERIDLVLVRGASPLSAELVGVRPEERTASGLWPSDHAGVTARIRVGP